MLIVSLLCFVMSKKVKIVSSEDPSLTLTILRNGKGANVRMMKEADIEDDPDQNIFSVNGEETRLENGGEYICGKPKGMGVVTCASEDSRKTLFKIIDKADNVKLQTEGKLCLTVAGFDARLNGNHLHLKKCTNNEKQEFKLVDVTPEKQEAEEKTPEKHSSLEIDLEIPKDILYNPLAKSLSSRKINNTLKVMKDTDLGSTPEYNQIASSSALRDRLLNNYSSYRRTSSILSDCHSPSSPSYHTLKRHYSAFPSDIPDVLNGDFNKRTSTSSRYRKRTYSWKLN